MSRVFLIVCLALLRAHSGPAESVSVVAVAAADFQPEEAVIPAGGRLFLVNADYPGEQNGHDLVSPLGLFGSDLTRTGEIAEVWGVTDLGPGRYLFRCSVHPVTMTGTLIIVAP